MTIESLQQAQAQRILAALEGWLAAAPGRSFRASYSLEDGWRAQLEERHSSRGESFAECLAQVATVCMHEVQP